MKRILTICVASTALLLGGCQGLADMLETNPTVVAVVDGIRVGCGYEASSTDIQALINSGLPGLKTIGNYVGAFCAAVADLPVAAARASGPAPVKVGTVSVRAQRIVK